LRLCGVLWSARYPCQMGLDSAPWPLTQPGVLTADHSCVRLLGRISQAAPPLARLALSTHVSWTRLRPVSVSSAKTLRRPLVCTLPLSVFMDLTAPPNLSVWYRSAIRCNNPSVLNSTLGLRYDLPLGVLLDLSSRPFSSQFRAGHRPISLSLPQLRRLRRALVCTLPLSTPPPCDGFFRA